MKKSIKLGSLPSQGRKSNPVTPSGKTTVLKRKPYSDYDMKPRQGAKDVYMNTVKNYEMNALFRENIFGSELITGGTRYTFPNKKGIKNLKSLFIFKMVRRDAVNYLASHKIKKTKWQSSIVYNNSEKNIGKKIIGTDLDIAYWTIAYNLGIISADTHVKGNVIPEKGLLQASLSSLGRDKRYVKIKKGSLTPDVVIIKGDDRLKEVYNLVRQTCYGYMKHLAKKLGNDFIAYKTDCIFYVNTKKNVKLVNDFFDQKALDYKEVRLLSHLTRYGDE